MKAWKNLSSDRLIEKAFHTDNLGKLIQAAQIRRNIYLGLFCISFLSILVCALTNRPHVAIVALFLTTLSLVVVTKYDIHLMFLRIIRNQQAKKLEQDTEEN
ncbi:MAG: hypothetical protein K9M45_11615 [Kiritimatiellales bacterium]|nr:hypothetical protein [Kiritimatiellales bacterium]